MSPLFGMVFPGQGSQSRGMLSEFSSPIIQKTFQQASEILSYDLWDVVQRDPDNKLNQTEITQPALLASSIALWRYWCEHIDRRPSVLSGHSLGEYTALVCAEALSFEDAVMLVSKRGQFMQEAIPEGEGAMAAIV
jgi:[acyl-carrier-protein] S-malonyltransferase